VISLLVEAQSAAPDRRTAGGVRCGMSARTWRSVIAWAGRRVSLLAGPGADHVDDHDGVVGASAPRRTPHRRAWMRQAPTPPESGFDTSVLVAAMDRSRARATARPQLSLLVTEPTETRSPLRSATPPCWPAARNEAPARDRVVRAVAHLLDAVEDYRDDVARESGIVAATETSVEAARRLCDDAYWGSNWRCDVEFTTDVSSALLTARCDARLTERSADPATPAAPTA